MLHCEDSNTAQSSIQYTVCMVAESEVNLGAEAQHMSMKEAKQIEKVKK